MYLEKDKKRSKRRLDFKKKKDKIKKMVSFIALTERRDEKSFNRLLGKFSNTPHARSFYMLGNERKLNKGEWKYTIQERKNF